jgi:hypothetical protein
MQMGKVALSIFALLLILFTGAQASEIGVSRVAEPAEVTASYEAPGDQAQVLSPQATYDGTLRVYVVERFSRYINSDGVPHDNGFLDWGTIENFSLDDGNTWESNFAWSATPFSGVIPSRMRAVAVVARQETFGGDADPPTGRFFLGNRVDAAAAAYVGVPGFNETGPGFTHTVFIEEGSATW